MYSLNQGSNFVEQVAAIIGPPPNSVGQPDDFEHLEGRLGVAFPARYKEFLTNYGPGTLSDDVLLYHPTFPLPGFSTLEELVADVFEQADIEPLYFFEDSSREVFRVGTQVGELIPFGEGLNWVSLYFIVSDSGDWEVLEYRQGDYERSGLGFDSWLLRYLSGGGSAGYFVTPKPELIPRRFIPANLLGPDQR